MTLKTDPIEISFTDLDSATRTVLGEARDQGQEGMTAVAWAIRNRVEWSPSAWWGMTVDQVCRKSMQFSCWNGGKNTDYIKALATTDLEYIEAKAIVTAVFDGSVADPTGGSTTYKVRGTPASWDHAVASVEPRSIGAHDFWRLDPHGPVLAFSDQAASEGAA